MVELDPSGIYRLFQIQNIIKYIDVKIKTITITNNNQQQHKINTIKTAQISQILITLNAKGAKNEKY